MKRHPWLYSLLVILAIWFLGDLASNRPIIPSPWETLRFVASNSQLLLVHMGASLVRVLGAIVLTTVFGGVLGVLTARNDRMDQLFSPLLYTLYPVPKIAFLPLIMLLFGLGNFSKILLVTLILFFQVTMTIRDNVRGIPDAYFRSIRSLGATTPQVYRHVILPASLPGLFTALRLSVGTSISVLFFAENFATRHGIGYFIMDSWLKLDYTAMFAGILAISVMGTLLFVLLDRMERDLCPWTGH